MLEQRGRLLIPALGVARNVGGAHALIGHVRRSADGFFQYYRGPLNLLMYEFEDDNLERLKQRIASREAPIALTY